MSYFLFPISCFSFLFFFFSQFLLTSLLLLHFCELLLNLRDSLFRTFASFVHHFVWISFLLLLNFARTCVSNYCSFNFPSLWRILPKFCQPCQPFAYSNFFSTSLICIHVCDLLLNLRESLLCTFAALVHHFVSISISLWLKFSTQLCAKLCSQRISTFPHFSEFFLSFASVASLAVVPNVDQRCPFFFTSPPPLLNFSPNEHKPTVGPNHISCFLFTIS